MCPDEDSCIRRRSRTGASHAGGMRTGEKKASDYVRAREGQLGAGQRCEGGVGVVHHRP